MAYSSDPSTFVNVAGNQQKMGCSLGNNIIFPSKITSKKADFSPACAVEN
jgi:hypothetical protein